MESTAHSSGAERWLSEAVTLTWAGVHARKIVLLRGDLSARRFWRVHLESATGARAIAITPPTAILVDLGPHDLPPYARALKLVAEPLQEPPWINVHRFLFALGAPVPELYAADAKQRAMLVEDVGDDALFLAAKRDAPHAGDLYRLAIETLLVFHVEGSRRIDQSCVASQIAYDERLFEWEFKEFCEVGVAAVAPGADPAALAPELASLVARLGRYPRVFSHRDYHGQNLYLQKGPKLRVIDFQDALMAPAAQDLAVLLTTRDTADVITPTVERRLLDFYCAGLARRGAVQMSAGDFHDSYRLCVLQHALKMIGRFLDFDRAGKSGYARYVPYVQEQARRMLAELGGDFPRLRAALAA
ncbi:MAG TPA: phosphotransferase [Candidatus Binataceae bacterium]